MEFERDLPGDRESDIDSARKPFLGTFTNRTNSSKILCMRDVSETVS